MSEHKNLRAVTQRSRVLELRDGTTIELRPLTMRDFGTLEEEAAQAAKADLIATWAKNIHFLPEAIRDQKLLEAFDRAEKVTADSMPQKTVRVPLRDPATRKQLISNGQPVFEDRLVSFSEYWMANTIVGRLTAVWLSARRADPAITMDRVSEIFQRLGEESLEQAADAVGDLTKTKLGNGQPPDSNPGDENLR